MAPQQISACRGRASTLALRIKEDVPGQDTDAQDCFWSREPRGCVALGPAVVPQFPGLIVRSFVRPSPHASHAHTRTAKSGVNPISIPPGRAQHFGRRRYYHQQSSSDWHRAQTELMHALLPPTEMPTSASASFGTLSNPISRSLIMIRPRPPQTNHVSILQISVPGPNARNGPLAPLAGTSPPA